MSEPHDSARRLQRVTLDRRRLLAGAGLAAAAVGLAACAPGTSPVGPAPSNDRPSVPTEITGEIVFWTINLKEVYADYITGLITAFESAHPGTKVNWVDVPGNQIEPKFITALASSEVPDAVNITNLQVAGASNQLFDLGTLLQADQFTDYVPGMLDPFKIDGKQVAIPWYHGGAPIMFYRKSVLEKVSGFDYADSPKDYPQVVDLAQKIYDAADTYGTTVIPSGTVMRYHGITMISDDKSTAAFNSPEAVAVIERYKDAYGKKAISPAAISSTANATYQVFDTGQVGFMISTPYILAFLKKNSPKAYADLEMTPAPRTAEGKFLLDGMQTLVVPAKSKNPATAAAFIQFITNAKNQVDFCKLVPIYPSSLEAIADPFFKEETGNVLEDRAKQMIAEELPDTVYVSYGTKHDAELTKVFDDGMKGYLGGSTSAATALADLADKWNTILAD